VAAAWQPKAFPLKGRDATARGVPAGPRVGQVLAAVEAWWIAEDFAPDRAACLAKLEELARA
jgi:poly(A) polymerase